MKKVLIRLQDVHFSYGQQPVLERVSFNLEGDSFYAITGANGSGKSTLVKLMLGLLKPTKGQIERPGLHQGRVGYVAQKGLSQSLGFPASVEEIVSLPLFTRKHKISKAEREKKILRVLRLLEIEPLRKRLISELSGGQLQRVLIARELITEPSILFLDEPTNALDKEMIQSLFVILEHLQKEHHVTIVLITHSDEQIREYIDVEYRLEDHHLVTLKGDQYV